MEGTKPVEAGKKGSPEADKMAALRESESRRLHQHRRGARQGRPRAMRRSLPLSQAQGRTGLGRVRRVRV